MASAVLKQERDLKKQLDRLRRLGDECADQNGFEHDFLRVALYILRNYAKGSKAADVISEKAGDPTNLQKKGRERLLIEATVPNATAHNKSRWAVVLKWMVDQEVKNERFNLTLTANKGVAGIYAKARSKHRIAKKKAIKKLAW